MHWQVICAARNGAVDGAAMQFGRDLTACGAGFTRSRKGCCDALIARVASLDHLRDVAADDLLRFTVLQWHKNLMYS
jgi:hypothetical protein